MSVAAPAVGALVGRSLEIIRAGQHESGAYVASPDFGVYGYAWLRDGSFVADAMSRAGERESAEAFFDWAARIVVDEAGSVFIYNTKWFGPFSKRVAGVRFCPVGNGQDFRWVHLT